MPTVVYLYIAIGLLVSILPVKIGAALIDARRSGYIVSIIAGTVGILLWARVAKVIPYGIVFGLLASALVYMFALGTTYRSALLVALAQVVALYIYMYLVLRAFVTAVFGALGHPS